MNLERDYVSLYDVEKLKLEAISPQLFAIFPAKNSLIDRMALKKTNKEKQKNNVFD